MITRDKTKKIMVGDLTLGGGSPVRIQSMTNTRTQDVEASTEQVCRLADAGCGNGAKRTDAGCGNGAKRIDAGCGNGAKRTDAGCGNGVILGDDSCRNDRAETSGGGVTV